MPEAAVPKQPLRLCLTGGGTAGHVTPHFALLPGIKARGWGVFYVGSRGIERDLVAGQGIEFYAIAAGKLRRYLSWQNLLDVAKVALGLVQALILLLRVRPDVVFSKGGFVAVPVAWAAWLLRIPVVSHESDVTPGLANRLIAPFARRLVYTFPETGRLVGPRGVHLGTPIRPELFAGRREEGARLCGWELSAPVPTLLVMGGSQGAKRLNDALAALLPGLLDDFRIIHLTGVGKGLGITHPRYRAFDFVAGEFKDLLALADAVVSRAGANSIFELLALNKPMLLVPLELGSRGDQVINAESFAARGYALVLRDRELTGETLRTAVFELVRRGADLQAKQREFSGGDAATRILDLIGEVAGRLPGGDH